MKRLKLLCLSAAVAATLFSSTVFADAVQPVQGTSDLDTIVNMAIQNSYKIKSIDIGIQQAQNSLNDVLRNSAKYSDQISQTEGDQKYALIKARDFQQAEYKYSIFQYNNTKEVAKNQVALSVYKIYSGLMTLKDGLDLEKQNFSNVEQQYNKAQLQLSLGTVSPVDVKASEATYVAEKAKLNQLQRQYDGYIRQFNQLLGVDVTKYIGFVADNLAAQAEPKTYDEYVKDALTNRAEIRIGNENINTKKFEFNAVRSSFPYNTQSQYKMAKYSVDKANNDLATEKIDIEIDINTLYNTLQTTIKSLEPAQNDYNSAKKTYDIALQNYNLGLMSKLDFDKAQINLNSKENSIKSIERNIWLAQKELDYASNLGADATSLMSSGN